MDLKETWMRPLTSSTTCYSGASSHSCSCGCDHDEHDHNDDETHHAPCSYFSTARHTVQIHTSRKSNAAKQHHGRCAARGAVNNDPQVNDDPQVTCKDVTSYCMPGAADCDPAAASSSSSLGMICVGYSSCPGWEVLVLLDPPTIPLSQLLPQDSVETTVPSSSSLRRSTSAPKNTTTTTTSNASVAPSTNTTNVLADDIISIATTAAHESSTVKPRQRRTLSSSEISLPESLASDFDAAINMNNDSNNDKSSNNKDSGIRAMLILRSLVVDDGENMDHAVPKCYSTRLSFRPLAPVVRLGKQQQHPLSKHPLPKPNIQTKKSTATPIIWLGSADTCQLYCFTLGEKVAFTAAEAAVLGSTASCNNDKDDNVLPTKIIDLVPVALSDPAFHVDSPIMALDCSNVYNNNKTNNKDTYNTVDSHEDDDDASSCSSSPDCCSCLAVSCQDGTIRFITFVMTTTAISNGPSVDHGGVVVGAFGNVQATTFIIDGPSVCLHLSLRSNHGGHDRNDKAARDEEGRTLYATIGSLCGYVTVLYTRDIFGMVKETKSSTSPTNVDDHDIRKNGSAIVWEGPFIMAEGFWNQHLEAEDSVLAVHDVGRNGLVAFGTHAGRCFLYQAVSKCRSINSSNTRSNITSSPELHSSGEEHKDGQHVVYRRIWECQLPYSIHGICHLPNYDSSSNSDNNSISSPLSLLVTTRKSVHVFTQQTPTIVYDAALAKKRIDALLVQVQQQVQQKEDLSEIATTAETESHATIIHAGRMAVSGESDFDKYNRNCELPE